MLPNNYFYDNSFKLIRFLILVFRFFVYAVFLNSCFTKAPSFDCNQLMDCDKKSKSDLTFDVDSFTLKKKSYNYKSKYNKILHLIRERKYTLAQKEISIFERHLPENIFVMKLKAYLFFLEKEYSLSYDLYQNLLKKLPTDSEILYNLAYLSWFLKKDKKNSEYFLRKFLHENGSVSMLTKEWVKKMGFSEKYTNN